MKRPRQLLHQTVAHHARSPSAIAIVDREARITYQELDRAADRLARCLVAAGCTRGDRVALLLPKSIPAFVGIVGALKAGCVYVPLDASSPPARLAKMIESAEPRCMLGVAATASLVRGLAGERIRAGWLDRDDFGLDEPADALSIDADPDDAAYILFTSGSTGAPKGVVISHANVMCFASWAVGYFQIDASDRLSCHPPLHFDLSTLDVWVNFLAGAELHLVPAEVSLVPHRIAQFIRDSKLTQWNSVPSALKYLAQFDVVEANDFPTLERLMWCGEALPTRTLVYLMQRLPHVTFTNMYGPTEATVASSYYTVPACPDNETVEIPIGMACEGEALLVLDDELKPCAPEVIGELYISGCGLSSGYWRDPEKTRSAFLDLAGTRVYKTGDLGRLGRDGLYYIHGRADRQIKSRGFRIELGEIEAALRALGSLRECAVVAIKTDGFEGSVICCAYAAAPGREVIASELRRQVAEALPAYMVPSRWLAFDALPMNANGKIDTPRLREQFAAMDS